MLKLLFDGITRGFRKNKLDFFLNLFGLSFAMLVFMCISIYVNDELSYDMHHVNGERIYRLTTSLTSPNGQQTNMAVANTAFAHLLKNKYPEFEEIVCVDVGGDYSIKYMDHEYKHINIREATPSIFEVFSYPVIEGSVEEFLKSPNTIVLTETLSRSIFNESPPLGKIITIDNKNYTVNGIIEDLPGNSDLQFAALKYSAINGSEELVDWGDYFVYCSINSANLEVLKTKTNELTDDKYIELLEQMGGFILSHDLQPLHSIHFDNTLLADTPKGNKEMVYLFSGIAFLILVIAAINYINLYTAQLNRRQKEFSIRKCYGCSRNWILFHVLSESFVNFILAALFALALSLLMLPFINELFGKQFTGSSIIQQTILLLFIFAVTGILSGIYPAYKINKTETSKHLSFSRFGKILVVFQNCVSIIMIAAVLLLGKQIQFMKNHDLGLGISKKKIVAINLQFDPNNFPEIETLRQEFSSLPEIESLAFGGGGTNLGATDNWMKSIMIVEDEQGNEVQFVANQPRIDYNYMDLFGIKLIEGRTFNPTSEYDKKWAVIINSTYARTMRWKNPIGKLLSDESEYKVIGVIEDFHFDALYNPIEPLIFQILENNPDFLFASVEPKNLKHIKNHWEKTFSDVPFEYSFIDDHFNTLYHKNEKEMTILSYMTFIAIIISCMGLYGLTSHFTINKTKEIGIRKVNGASIIEILIILNKDFIKWVAIAFIIAVPIAWYAMDSWLENFAYKTTLSWWIFVLAGALALGIAVLTVSWQSWKAATRNPVEALRYE
ncbi:MAG: ABC transporter permease [Bacteroidetes bacterium]|nr:ABC transporter permease [Bacteroidota bacterium]